MKDSLLSRKERLDHDLWPLIDQAVNLCSVDRSLDAIFPLIVLLGSLPIHLLLFACLIFFFLFESILLFFMSEIKPVSVIPVNKGMVPAVPVNKKKRARAGEAF
uniref:hypothetical protein n=1 Tax=Jatropha curcas TaxID=180498 RepID=UPI0027A888BB|nr:hypothetical protein QLP06_mgp035 [Jatropha curcas]WFG81204.1 hypothetical protein [Jatropha curcas]